MRYIKHAAAAFAGIASLAFCILLFAQSGFPPPPPKVSAAAGSIDIHVHSDPDAFNRSLDDYEVARIAARKGMRGIVLKSHVATTADRAVLLGRAFPGLEVWGGIALNRAVGGVNPDAVEWFHRMAGGRGKVVWLPTFDSDNQHKILKEPGEGLKVAVDGKLLPETEAVLKIIARENLSLATGHVSPQESLAVIKRAKELGVKNIVVTHAMAEVPGMTLEQVKEAVAMGAYIEYCFLNDIHGAQSYWSFLRSWKRVSFADIAKVIKEVGAQHFILSSDLGQNGTPTHPDGMEMMINGMKREGISQADVDLMVKKNPARWLGLEG
jgi:Family of unknown function (DUF6282)